MTKEKIDDWFEIKLLIDCKKVCDIKQCIQDETYQNATKIVFKKLKIFSNHFVHFGRGIGPNGMMEWNSRKWNLSISRILVTGN